MLVFNKDWKQYPPIPQSGVQEATELLIEGPLHRYYGSKSRLSDFEKEMATYVQKDFVLGLNSCGSALFIALKALGIGEGDKVLSNALTFNAVPSSIVHAGAEPVYIESTEDIVVDLDDLQNKAQASGSKCFLLSHMRGKIADLDKIYDYCDSEGIVVIEDCAHALGVKWNNDHVGVRAAISCFSSQSNKVINSGEGGMLATSDPDLAAKAALYSGCYETLYLKHKALPGAEYFEKYKHTLPNYSLRMTNLSAAILLPQLQFLEERIAAFNRRFTQVASIIEQRLPSVKVVRHLDKVRPVNDCLQFHLNAFTREQALSFIQTCRQRGVSMALFGEVNNSRNFRTWKFAHVPELPKTEEIISYVCDMSLPFVFDDKDWEVILSILTEVYLEHYNQSSQGSDRPRQLQEV